MFRVGPCGYTCLFLLFSFFQNSCCWNVTDYLLNPAMGTSNNPEWETSTLPSDWKNKSSAMVTTDEQEEHGGSSLLWLPYFFLTLVLVGLAAGSFLRFHHKNKRKYRGTQFIVTRTGLIQKARVTLNDQAKMPPFSPDKVIPDLPIVSTPELVRSRKWQHSMQTQWQRQAPSNQPGKFENAGYFLDQLTAKRSVQRSRSRSLFQKRPGFVGSLLALKSRHSSLDHPHISNHSSQFNHPLFLST